MTKKTISIKATGGAFSTMQYIVECWQVAGAGSGYEARVIGGVTSTRCGHVIGETRTYGTAEAALTAAEDIARRATPNAA